MQHIHSAMIGYSLAMFFYTEIKELLSKVDDAELRK
jgi:hypothetical protein